jgi:hypothetical protein
MHPGRKHIQAKMELTQSSHRTSFHSIGPSVKGQLIDLVSAHIGSALMHYAVHVERIETNFFIHDVFPF